MKPIFTRTFWSLFNKYFIVSTFAILSLLLLFQFTILNPLQSHSHYANAQSNEDPTITPSQQAEVSIDTSNQDSTITPGSIESITYDGTTDGASNSQSLTPGNIVSVTNDSSSPPSASNNQSPTIQPGNIESVTYDGKVQPQQQPVTVVQKAAPVGVQQPAPVIVTQQQPVVVQQTVEMVTTCNNKTISRAQMESELHGANYPGPWNNTQEELAAYNRAACPAPVEMVTTCKNQTIPRAQLQSELRGANYPGPWGDVSVELAAYNRAACPTPTATPIQYITVCNGKSITIDQFRSDLRANGYSAAWGNNQAENDAYTRIYCPAPTVQVQTQPQTQTQTQSQSIIVNTLPQSVVTYAENRTSSQPSVVTTPNPTPVVYKSAPNPDVEQLPQTGPAAAILLSGLIPIGLTIKRLGKDRQIKDTTANSIWQKKQLKDNE